MTVTETAALDQLTTGVWDVDPAHSTVEFVVRHAMISKVRGSFTAFAGEVHVADDARASSVRATVDLGSVDTGDVARDEHLRSADFFDVEQDPGMVFESTGLHERRGGWLLAGNLTIHGHTRPVDFDLEFHGVSKDPFGRTRAGFSATAKISRKDFGLQWNVALEAGGVLVSDTVTIELEIAAVRREPVAED